MQEPRTAAKVCGICKRRTSIATNAETSNRTSKRPTSKPIQTAPVEGGREVRYGWLGLAKCRALLAESRSIGSAILKDHMQVRIARLVPPGVYDIFPCDTRALSLDWRTTLVER